MKHLSEEQIVLHYYADAEEALEVRRHLRDCPACQAKFERVQAVLTQIEPTEVPEPPEFFEEKTWLNLRDRLARQTIAQVKPRLLFKKFGRLGNFSWFDLREHCLHSFELRLAGGTVP